MILHMMESDSIRAICEGHLAPFRCVLLYNELIIFQYHVSTLYSLFPWFAKYAAPIL